MKWFNHLISSSVKVFYLFWIWRIVKQKPVLDTLLIYALFIQEYLFSWNFACFFGWRKICRWNFICLHYQTLIIATNLEYFVWKATVFFSENSTIFGIKTTFLYGKPTLFVKKWLFYEEKRIFYMKNRIFGMKNRLICEDTCPNCEDTCPNCKENRFMMKSYWRTNTLYVYEWEWKCEINWNTIWQCIFCLLYFKIECKIKYLHTKKCFSLVKLSLVLFFLHTTMYTANELKRANTTEWVANLDN